MTDVQWAATSKERLHAFYNLSLAAANFDSATVAKLAAHDVLCIGDLVTIPSMKCLKKLPGVGPCCVREIEVHMRILCLEFGQDLRGWERYQLAA